MQDDGKGKKVEGEDEKVKDGHGRLLGKGKGRLLALLSFYLTKKPLRFCLCSFPFKDSLLFMCLPRPASLRIDWTAYDSIVFLTITKRLHNLIFPSADYSLQHFWLLLFLSLFCKEFCGKSQSGLLPFPIFSLSVI